MSTIVNFPMSEVNPPETAGLVGREHGEALFEYLMLMRETHIKKDEILANLRFLVNKRQDMAAFWSFIEEMAAWIEGAEQDRIEQLDGGEA